MTKWLIVAIGAMILYIITQRRQDLRRRLGLGIRVGLAAYGALFVARLLIFPPNEAELRVLVAVASAFGLIWLGLWIVAQRRRGRHAGP